MVTCKHNKIKLTIVGQFSEPLFGETNLKCDSSTLTQHLIYCESAGFNRSSADRIPLSFSYLSLIRLRNSAISIVVIELHVCSLKTKYSSIHFYIHYFLFRWQEVGTYSQDLTEMWLLESVTKKNTQTNLTLKSYWILSFAPNDTWLHFERPIFENPSLFLCARLANLYSRLCALFYCSLLLTSYLSLLALNPPRQPPSHLWFDLPEHT